MLGLSKENISFRYRTVIHTNLKRGSESIKLGEKIMKKSVTSILGIAMLALMIAAVSAQTVPTVPCPPDEFYCRPCEGLTPGFWKHNIQVYLGDKNGAYSAFPWGAKVTAVDLEDALAYLNFETGLTLTMRDVLDFLQEPGWSMDRTNAANWFNYFHGMGPFPMD